MSSVCLQPGTNPLSGRDQISAGGRPCGVRPLAGAVASSAVRTLSNFAQRLEVGVVAGARAIVGIELDGPQQYRNGLVDLVPQREHGREHIQGVIVLGRFGAGGPQVLERLLVVPGIDREGRGEDTFFRRRRETQPAASCGARRR